MNNDLERSNYRHDIQGLRAVAVLLVVFYHAGFDFLPGGYIGVDVFFVISGYLITSLLASELKRSNDIDIINFYSRRIRRLLPAATVVLITTICVAWSAYSPLELKQFLSSAFATAIYLSNVWFAHLSTDYLAENTDANPLLHTWSLSAEEQFYLVWPIFILLLYKKKPVEFFRRNLAIGILIACMISLILAIFLTYYNQPLAFFISPTRAWEFGFGGLVALWLPKHQFIDNKIYFLSELLGLILILSAAYLFNDHTNFPGFSAIVPVLGASLIIASSHSMRPSFINRFLGVKPLQFFGNISYSLYLWHWPIFVFMDLKSENIELAERIVGLLGAFFLAFITYTLVENPFRFNKFLLKRAYTSIVLGFLLTTFSASFALSTRELTISSIKNEAQQRYLAASTDKPNIYFGMSRCHADFFQTNTPDCIFGKKTSEFTVVLFGDSHAAQWFPALEKIANKKGLRLVSLTKTGCPSIMFDPYEEKLGRTYTECGEWREHVFERIKKLNPKITIIANSKKYINTNDYDKVLIWKNGLRNMLEKISGFSDKIVIIRDTPWLDFSAPTCLSRADWQGNNPSSQCILKQLPDNPDLIFDAESTELSSLHNGFTIDMTKVICPNIPCLIERDGFILYHDSHHLTASFSRHIADQLMEKLQPFLPRN